MRSSAVTRSPGGARGRGWAGWAKKGSPAGIATVSYAVRDRADLRVASLRPADAADGMEDLQQVLTKAGVTSLQGWILLTANRVSADGTVNRPRLRTARVAIDDVD